MKEVICRKEFKNGFTLIELLVAVAAVGVLATVAVNLLYTTVLSRSRQNSIQTSSDDIRNFISLFTKSVRESESIEVVNALEIKTVNATVCRIFRLSGTGAIELAEDTSGTCAPTAFTEITGENTEITQPGGATPDLFSENGSSYVLQIQGFTKDSFGQHDFKYQTSVTPRL